MKGIYVGVPVVIGSKGVERIVEIKLDPTERAMFRKSVKAVKALVSQLPRNFNATWRRRKPPRPRRRRSENLTESKGVRGLMV